MDLGATDIQPIPHVWQALGQGDEPISLGCSLDWRRRQHSASGSCHFKNPSEAGVALMEILLCAKDLARAAA